MLFMGNATPAPSARMTLVTMIHLHVLQLLTQHRCARMEHPGSHLGPTGRPRDANARYPDIHQVDQKMKVFDLKTA